MLEWNIKSPKNDKKNIKIRMPIKSEPIEAGNVGIKFVLVKLVGSRFVVS